LSLSHFLSTSVLCLVVCFIARGRHDWSDLILKICRALYFRSIRFSTEHGNCF
jgi:hypothetical protein